MATYKLDRGFTVARTFDAPPDVVFEAWTVPDFLGWFFNPGVPIDEPTSVDLRVGGEWRQQMVETAEKQYFTGGIYREIVPHERLVFSWGARGGWPDLDPDKLDDAPLVTILLTPSGARTEMLFRLQLPDHLSEERTAEWMASGMRDGWSMTIDRLVARYAQNGERVA